MTIATQSSSEEENQYKAYARLRIMLDSMQELSKLYYSQGKSSEEKLSHLQELEKILSPCINEIRLLAMKNSGDEDIQCPAGMEPCHGYCVYVC